MASFRDSITARLRAKLKAADGETLVETLVATLIMALVMLMLCTAIVSAAKINASAKAAEINFDQGRSTPLTEMTVTVTPITPSQGASKTMQIGQDFDAYNQNGFVYYEPHKASENN